MSPESLHDLEEFLLLDDAVEVDPVHGQQVLDLFGGKLVQVVFGLDLVQPDQALAGEPARWAARG